MQSISSIAFRYISLVSIFALLFISSSCNKEEEKSTSNSSGNAGSNENGTSAQPLIASAKMNFVSDNEVIDFKCYKREDYGEVIIYGDTSLFLRFRSIDENNDYLSDQPTVLINVKNLNGFTEGDTYSFATNSNSQKMTVSIAYGSGTENYYAQINNTSGEFKITSFDGAQIKGDFNLTVFGLIDASRKVIISDSQFESNVTHN